ncbi:MAG: hypothetical protein H6Q15_2160 [Bacteroidetes bacterium]|nr:hypothetical protein [Bacteroidota bacterium]
MHDYWLNKIANEFGFINLPESSNYLSLINYLEKKPQKFYSKPAFTEFLCSLNTLLVQDEVTFSQILIDSENQISLSNNILNDINQIDVNDIHYPKENYDLINFIDKHIHYNLLKLYETPLFYFSQLVSKCLWLMSGKKIDGLDLYNSIEELKKTGFPYLNEYYLHDVRNGIAHGKIIYTDTDISYYDKKDKKASLPTKKIIEVFDNALDIVNGFCLAYKVFCISNQDFFNKYKIPIPQSILLEELQAKVNAPAWKICNTLDSIALKNKKQLMIYVKNENWDYNKVLFLSFTTAYWAEKLTSSYNRIFFSFHSTHSKISSGWSAFNADKLRELRLNKETKLEDYKGVLEGDLLYFIPKFIFPKFIYKIGTLLSSLRIIFPIHLKKYLDTYFPQPFYLRETQIHTKGYFTVIVDPSIIIKHKFQIDIQNLIRHNRQKIVRLAINKSKATLPYFSKTRLYPVKYIRLFVYDMDKRVRQLQNSGLIEELICSIEVNTTRRISTIDINGGTVEQIGKYRIVWNKKWLEKQGKRLQDIVKS